MKTSIKEIAMRIKKDEREKQRKTSKGIKQDIKNQMDRVTETTDKKEKEK